MLVIPLTAREASISRMRVQSVRSSRLSTNPFFKRTYGPHFSGMQIQNRFVPPKFPHSSKRAKQAQECKSKEEEVKDTTIEENYNNCSDDLIFQFNKLANYKGMIEQYKARMKTVSPVFQLRGLTVALDLDETLMHVIPKQFMLNHPCCIFLKNKFSNYCIIKRPLMDLFISTIKEFYNIVIFTSSERRYAVEVLRALEIEKLCNYHLICRDQCDILGNAIILKNLYKVSSNLDTVLLVDNSILSFSATINNGIFIPPFTGNSNDRELMLLTTQLLKYKDELNFNKYRSPIPELLDYHCSVAN